MSDTDIRSTACPYCRSTLPPVWVHGHAQCAACKINIEPCCGGASGCELEVGEVVVDRSCDSAITTGTRPGRDGSAEGRS